MIDSYVTHGSLRCTLGQYHKNQPLFSVQFKRFFYETKGSMKIIKYIYIYIRIIWKNNILSFLEKLINKWETKYNLSFNNSGTIWTKVVLRAFILDYNNSIYISVTSCKEKKKINREWIRRRIKIREIFHNRWDRELHRSSRPSFEANS